MRAFLMPGPYFNGLSLLIKCRHLWRIKNMASFRYLVSNVDESVAFYTAILDFELEEQFGPAMAIVRRGDLTVWLAGPSSSAAKPMPDGSQPVPGGWNRAVIEVDDIETTVERMKSAGARLRNDVVLGPGGRQVLVDDPSGNPVELFQPLR